MQRLEGQEDGSKTRTSEFKSANDGGQEHEREQRGREAPTGIHLHYLPRPPHHSPPLLMGETRKRVGRVI